MAVMLFGIAISPAFSDGMAFAHEHPGTCSDHERDQNGCEKTQKESRKTQKVKYDCTIPNPAPQCG